MAPSRSASRAANSSATDSCTWNRFAAVHASPMLRILASTAPSTAASRSASSKTRNGALPPSSIETRSTCCAAAAINRRPTSVEPVNDSLRSRGSSSNGTGGRARGRRGHDVQHAGREAGLGEGLREREHRQRGERGRLDDDRAAGCDRGPDLAGAHRGREVPRRDEQARTDGLAQDEHPSAAARLDRVAAVDADRLLREPAEELGGVLDLAARVVDGLAHLERHQEREIVGALGEQLVGAAKDLAAFPRRMRRPGLLGGLPPRRAPRSRRWRRRRPRRTATCPSPGPRPANVLPDAAGRHSPPMNKSFGTASITACSCESVAMAVASFSPVCSVRPVTG